MRFRVLCEDVKCQELRACRIDYLDEGSLKAWWLKGCGA